MAKSGFKLNYKGVGNLLKSSEMKTICIQYANSLAQNDPGPHSINSRVGKKRVNAEIRIIGLNAYQRKEDLV